MFEGFDKLEEVSFNGNELGLIEPNILNGLTKLKKASFEDNPAYTKCFIDFPQCESNATLQDVKDELFVRFYRDYKNVEDLLKVEDEVRVLKESIEILRTEIEDRKHQKHETCKSMQSDIKRFLRDDDSFKDFHIQINDQKFPVHKILLAARSPTLAEILKKNPDVENLNLVDIPVDIFEKILHFLYTDEFPNNKGINLLDLFAAAGKLKIESLKDLAATMIIAMIKTENALDILKLSSKYEHEELKLAAFKKIKEKYPKIDFNDDWIKDVDTVINIIEAYKMKEEAIKKAEEEFKKLVLKNEKFAN